MKMSASLEPYSFIVFADWLLIYLRVKTSE